MDASSPARFHLPADAGCRLWPTVEAPPPPGLRVCVVIPAKNEADSLPGTVAALAAQVASHGQPLLPEWYEVIILANNCTDATAATVRALAGQYPLLRLHLLEAMLPPAEAHVGRARRLLMDEAARRLERAGRPGGIIATTDADTRVASDWLAALLAEFAAGADAVGGRILPAAPAAAHCPIHRLHLRDTAFRLGLARLEHLLDPCAADPWPRHHQHFGGSLALTAAAYRRVGGLPVVPYLEDDALWQLLQGHDLALRHSPRVRVYTSHRQQGRVAVGLSWQLRTWADDAAAGREPLMPHPALLAAEWQLRLQLRSHWQQRRAIGTRLTLPIEVAELLGRLPAGLLAALPQAPTFGAWWQQVQPAATAVARAKWPDLPLALAEAELRQQLRWAEALASGQQVEPVGFAAVTVAVA